MLALCSGLPEPKPEWKTWMLGGVSLSPQPSYTLNSYDAMKINYGLLTTTTTTTTTRAWTLVFVMRGEGHTPLLLALLLKTPS